MKAFILAVLGLFLVSCGTAQIKSSEVKPTTTTLVSDTEQEKFILIRLPWSYDKDGEVTYQKLMVPENYKMLDKDVALYPFQPFPLGDQIICFAYSDPYMGVPLALLTVAYCGLDDLGYAKTKILAFGGPTEGTADWIYPNGPENTPVRVTKEELAEHLKKWQAKDWGPEDADLPPVGDSKPVEPKNDVRKGI